jgi:hypothetical protein
VSANLIYADLYNGKACKSASGEAMVFSDWVAGGSVSFGLRFLDYVGGFNEVDADLAALRVAVGPIDSRPLSGKFKLKVGPAVSSSANTTGFLDWNVSAAAVEAALNALSVCTDAFACEELGGSIIIRRNDGAAATLAVVSNRMFPRAFGRITGSEIDGEWIYDLRLTIAALSFSDSAARVLPDAPSVTTIQNGGVDPSGTTVWNEIQALYIPPNFRGTYQLRYGYGKTILLSPEDGVPQIQAALNTILAMVAPASAYGSAGSCTVTNPATNIAHIEFGGGLAGLDLDELIVQVFSAPPGDWTFDLPLDLGELREALRGSAAITVPFEAEADFYIDPADHGVGTVTRKLWSTTINIKSPLIWPDMAVVPGVDWLFPNPTDYLPFSADQVITGQQHYVVTLGNGASDSFVITHGLATADISGIVVRDNATGAVMEPSTYEATINGADTVTIVFAAAPATNGVRAIITAAGPTSAFQDHHHAIAEIGDTVEGTYVPTLQNVLDDFGGRIERLEALIGRADVAVVTTVVTGNKKSEYSLPNVGEVLPDLNNEDSVATVASQVSASTTAPSVTIPNTDLEVQKAKAASDLAALNAEIAAVKKARDEAAAASAAESAAAVVIVKTTSVITRMTFPEIASQFPALRNGGKLPWLLPAINDADATDAAVLPTSPVAGSLYAATASFALPGGAGRKTQNVISGNKFGYDGRCFYRVVANGDSWSALEMDRELMRAVLRGEQFPAGSDLALSWSITAALVCDQLDAAARDIARTVDGAQYLLVAEAVPIPDATTSPTNTLGLNLGAEGTAVTLCSQRISLSPAVEEHNFAMALKRDSAGVGTGTVTRYGTGSSVPTLPTGAFVLRVRLAAFDVDDTSADARGQVKLSMPSCQLAVTLTR